MFRIVPDLKYLSTFGLKQHPKYNSNRRKSNPSTKTPNIQTGKEISTRGNICNAVVYLTPYIMIGAITGICITTAMLH